jgi:hypothetical protein
VSDSIGKDRVPDRAPSLPEFGNLTVTVSAAGADSWERWHEDFVINGNSGQDKEKNGTLTLLDPSLKTALLTIKLFNIGIFSLRSPKTDANADKVARLEAGLYVERMELVAGGK